MNLAFTNYAGQVTSMSGTLLNWFYGPSYRKILYSPYQECYMNIANFTYILGRPVVRGPYSIHTLKSDCIAR